MAIDNTLVINDRRPLAHDPVAPLDWIIVERFIEEREVGGIVLPEEARIDNPLAKVISVGPGHPTWCNPVTGEYPTQPCKAGDVVVVARYLGHTVQHRWIDENEKMHTRTYLCVKWGDICQVWGDHKLT